MLANPDNRRVDWRNDLLFLMPCLVVAVLVRSFFFGSITLADGVNYWIQIIATGLDNAWPPEKTHWHTRIGFILPCVLLVKIFGLKVWVPYLFTLLGGLLEIAFTLFIARQFICETAARLATWLAVFFPLNILYSGCLYPDLWSGLLGALSLWFWYRALQTDHAREYAFAAIFFGLGWLVRETVIMGIPIYLVLWFQAGRWRRPKMLWAIPFGLLFLVGEMALYQISVHESNYRFTAILQAKAQMVEDVANDSGFMSAPFVQLFTSHELGLFLVTGLLVALLGYRQFPKALVLWLVVGFIWFSWGTTTPIGWIPLQRDPRYLSILTIPCLALLAAWICTLRSAFWRRGIISAFILSGLICALLDVGRIKIAAHQRFAASEYNAPTTTAEPFVYFGIRAAQNFSADSGKVSCANDLGRASAVKLMPHLPNVGLLASVKAHYVVFSTQTQPEKWKTKLKEGWRKVAEIRGQNVYLREQVRRLIGKIQGRPELNSDFGLIVLENPAFASASK